VDVRGNELLPAPLIIKKANLPAEKNLFSIDTKKAKESLLKFRVLEKVSFKKHFPNTMLITVKERVPIATFLFKKKLYYIDEKGKILSKVNSKLVKKISNKLDYPVITGINHNLPVNERKKMIALALKLLALFSYSPLLENVYISEVHVDSEKGLSILTSKNSLPIFFGFDAFARKIKYLSFVLRDLEKKQLQVSKINLDFQKIVVVKRK
jgi:cell division protein FtsQ